MAKIKIAQNPTFAAEVQIPRIGGDPVPVEFKFRYLNRTELAKLYDSWRKGIQESSQEHGEDASLEQVIESQIRQQVRQIKDIVVGWAFDDKFTDEAIAELVKTCTGAPQAVIDAYQAAYSQARLGN